LRIRELPAIQGYGQQTAVTFDSHDYGSACRNCVIDRLHGGLAYDGFPFHGSDDVAFLQAELAESPSPVSRKDLKSGDLVAFEDDLRTHDVGELVAAAGYAIDRTLHRVWPTDGGRR
jgi:hypothetical protein